MPLWRDRDGDVHVVQPVSRWRTMYARQRTHADALVAELFSTLPVGPGTTEYRFCEGRGWRFDYAWPYCKVAVELEGGVWAHGRHVRGQGYTRDCEKYNAAVCLGWAVLRYTGQMLTANMGGCQRQLGELLMRRQHEMTPIKG